MNTKETTKDRAAKYVFDVANRKISELEARVAELETALAKSDPWKGNSELTEFTCIHCEDIYNPIAIEPKDNHAADCIWITAVLKGLPVRGTCLRACTSHRQTQTGTS